jgi:hypothetical protein
MYTCSVLPSQYLFLCLIMSWRRGKKPNHPFLIHPLEVGESWGTHDHDNIWGHFGAEATFWVIPVGLNSTTSADCWDIQRRRIRLGRNKARDVSLHCLFTEQSMSQVNRAGFCP